MADIVLHLNDYRMEALEEALEDSGGVEKWMQDYLIDLYSDTVPFDKQREIQKQIDAERQRENPEPEMPEYHDAEQPEYRAAARPLRPEDIEFRDDVLRFENLLNFKFVPDPPLCEALGVSADIWRSNALANAYINFDLASGNPENSLTATLTVDDHCGDTKEVRYPLNAEELAILLPKMDAYCQRNRGKSLADCALAYHAEESLKRERQPAKHPGKSVKKRTPER